MAHLPLTPDFTALTPLDLNQDGALQPEEVPDAPNPDQTKQLGKLVGTYVNGGHREEAAAFLRELGNLKPKPAWLVKHSLNRQPKIQLNADHTVEVDGYSFTVAANGEPPTRLELKRIAWVLAQNWDYLPLLAKGVLSPKGAVREEPLRFLLVPSEEINPVADTAYINRGRYIDRDNQIKLPRSSDLEVIQHELNHAIDDYLGATQPERISNISGSQSHGIYQTASNEACRKTDPAKLKRANLLYQTGEARALSKSEQKELDDYRDGLSRMGAFNSSQCFDGELVAYTHYFTGGGMLWDACELFRTALVESSLYGMPVPDSEKKEHAVGMLQVAVTYAGMGKRGLGLDVLAVLKKHFFSKTSISFEDKFSAWTSAFSALKKIEFRSQALDDISEAIFEIFWGPWADKLKNSALSSDQKNNLVDRLFDSLQRMPLAQAATIRKFYLRFFNDGRIPISVKLEGINQLKDHVLKSKPGAWEELFPVFELGCFANTQFPPESQAKAVATLWNLYAETNDSAKQADALMAYLLKSAQVPDTAKLAIAREAFNRTMNGFSRYDPATRQGFTNKTVFKYQQTFDSMSALMAAFLDSPTIPAPVKRQFLGAMESSAQYATNIESKKHGGPTFTHWESLLACWGASPVHVTIMGNLFRSIFSQPELIDGISETMWLYLANPEKDFIREETLKLYESILATASRHPTAVQERIIDSICSGVLKLEPENQAQAFKRVALLNANAPDKIKSLFANRLMLRQAKQLPAKVKSELADDQNLSDDLRALFAR